MYRLWELKNYSMLYEFHDKSQAIGDVKVTGNGLTEISSVEEKTNLVHIKVRSLHVNQIIHEFSVKVVENAEIEFVEYHDGNFLLKQFKHPLKVYDCREIKVNPMAVPSHLFEIPDAYLFLKNCNKVLLLKNGIFWVLDCMPHSNTYLKMADINNNCNIISEEKRIAKEKILFCEFFEK